MTRLEKDTLRQEILEDIKALKAIEGEAMRRNRGRRAERLFWTGLLLDVAEVAAPYTLAGRIAMRLIRRVAERERRISGQS